MRSRLLLAGKIAAALLILAGFVYTAANIDFSLMLHQISDASIGFMILGCLFYGLTALVDGWRIHIGIRPMVGIPIPFWKTAQITYASIAVGLSGAGSLGSEGFKVVRLQAAKVPNAFLISMLVGLRILGFAVSVSVGLLALLTLTYGPWLALSALLLGLSALAALYFSRPYLTQTLPFVSRNKYLRGLGRHLQTSWTGLPKLVYPTLFLELARILTTLAFLAAFDFNLHLEQGVVLATASTLAMFVPFTPNGLGVREGVVVSLLLGYGIGVEAASAYAITTRGLLTVIGLFGLVFIGQAVKPDANHS